MLLIYLIENSSKHSQKKPFSGFNWNLRCSHRVAIRSSRYCCSSLDIWFSLKEGVIFVTKLASVVFQKIFVDKKNFPSKISSLGDFRSNTFNINNKK